MIQKMQFAGIVALGISIALQVNTSAATEAQAESWLMSEAELANHRATMAILEGQAREDYRNAQYERYAYSDKTCAQAHPGSVYEPAENTSPQCVASQRHTRHSVFGPESRLQCQGEVGRRRIGVVRCGSWHWAGWAW